MLNTEGRNPRGSSTRAPLAVLLLVLLAMPLQVGAQQSAWQGAKDGSKRGKWPPLRARVVTDTHVGVPVVVAEGGEVSAWTRVVPANASVRIVMEGPGAAQARQPEVENWLVGGPPQPESWLGRPAESPTREVFSARASAPVAASGAAFVSGPVAAPVAQSATAGDTRSVQLLGVHRYVEATQTPPGAGASATRRPSLRVTMPSRAADTSFVPAPVGAPEQAPAVAGTYLLGPGDQIDVYVWRNPDLSRSVPVRPDGLISLPLAGELQATGKTVAQLNAEITTVLEEYVQHPTVTVTVTQVRSIVIYVNGRVTRAGPLTLDRPINVVQAITMAGGLQEFADRNGVVVIRTINGKRVRIPFRYGDAVKGKGNIAEFILQSGDVVYVP